MLPAWSPAPTGSGRRRCGRAARRRTRAARRAPPAPARGPRGTRRVVLARPGTCSPPARPEPRLRHVGRARSVDNRFSFSIENHSHVGSPRVAARSLAVLALPRRCAGRRAALTGRRTTATARSSRRSTRWPYVAERVAGDDGRSTNLTDARRRAARPRAHHRGRPPSVAGADLVVYERRLPAGRRRRRRRDRRGRRGRRRRRGRACATATSDEHAEDGHDHEGDLDPHFWLDPLLMADLGRRGRRTSWPSSTRTTPTTTAPTPPDLRADLERARRGVRRRAGRLRSATRSWSATTRSATSATLRPRRRADRRPLPRRRADPGRTSPSCRT